MDKLRVAIAGLGRRAGWGVPAVLACADLELVALIDVVPQCCQMYIQEFNLGAIPCFTSLQSCIESVDFDVLAVFTPDGTHGELVVPALNAGKWVFVDKPLEITQDKLEQIIATDRRAGGRTFVGLNLRYAPAFAKARQLIEAGTIGQLLTIQQDEFYDGGRTYFRRWNRLRAHGGGLWITKACHDFDIMYWMAGAQPLSVSASASLDYYLPKAEAALYCRDCKLEPSCPDRFNQPMYIDGLAGKFYATMEKATGRKPDLCLYNSDKDTFDHGAALVSFANRVIGTYTVNVVAGFSNRRLRVSGTKGTIDVDLGANEVTLLHRDPPRVEKVQVDSGEGGHGGADGCLMSALSDFVRGRPTSLVRPLEAAVGVRMGLAAQQSCDQGCTIAIT